MLLREEHDGALLAITQPAHAALAGRLAEAWDDVLPAALVAAAGRHDDVWRARDAAPPLNAAAGRPTTFLELAPDERVALWSPAAAVAEPLGPEAELWVLRHAHRLHADPREPRVRDMAASFAARGAELVARLRTLQPERFDDGELARGTSLLALWDTLSLALSAGVREPRAAGVLALAPAPGGAVAVAPWPFATRRLDTRVQARRLPGHLADQAALDAAWAAAAPFDLPITLVAA